MLFETFHPWPVAAGWLYVSNTIRRTAEKRPALHTHSIKAMRRGLCWKFSFALFLGLIQKTEPTEYHGLYAM